jgi:Mrp family chromosome partitioning ATPase
MPHADIFRIIDVVAEPISERAQPMTENASAERGDVTVALTTWSSPAPSTTVARKPTPMLDVEYLPRPPSWNVRLVMLAEPLSDRARGYRSLRHRLLSSGDPRMIAVTSARPEEGKTTCALNLALAIAEDAMMRVLLLEANLCRPSLAAIFGFEPHRSFMSDMSRLSDVGPPYPVAGISGVRIHFAALPQAPIAEGHIEKTLFSIALANLRRVYDYIVIDAASVLESGDTDVVGECADGVLLAARARVSQKRELRRAIEQLRPAPVLGTVLLDA